MNLDKSIYSEANISKKPALRRFFCDIIRIMLFSKIHHNSPEVSYLSRHRNIVESLFYR